MKALETGRGIGTNFEIHNDDPHDVEICIVVTPIFPANRQASLRFSLWPWNQAPAGPDGVRKLLHIPVGNIPSRINAIWLTTKASSHQNAAAMKP